MKGGGHHGIIGPFSLLASMTEIGRSANGGITQITYKFLDDSGGIDQPPGDRLVDLKFSLDLTNPTERSWGGITKVSLKKDGDYYVAIITLSKSSMTFSVDNLPPPTSSTLASYNVVSAVNSPTLNVKLLGTKSNDALIGGSGNDRLKAYGGTREEVDILTGGTGADTFVLGDRNAQGQSDFGVSYQGSGHAIITDFDRSAGQSAGFFDSTEGDKIQLMGKATDYQLKLEDKHIGFSSSLDRSTWDTTISYKGDVIAYVQDIDLTSLSSTLATNPAFTFV